MSFLFFKDNGRLQDPKLLLLVRFHFAVIVVNVLAVFIDMFLARYHNVWIELLIAIALVVNLWFLDKYLEIKRTAYFFIFVVSSGLFTLIYINHFATMSIVFVLLLPLTTLIFLSLKESFFIIGVLFLMMIILFYIESSNNPDNPLTSNLHAMFNLGYAALIIYLFGLLYHMSIIKTFKELDAANHQKDLLLKEVHHRVKNNLNVIASIIGLQSSSLDQKEKEQLLKSKSRIESIAIVHEMLYTYEHFERIEFTSYVKRLSTLLFSMFTNSNNIDLKVYSDVESLSLDKMVQIGIIINELITNSIKYAVKDKDGEISIELRKFEDVYRFSYCDNGPGHPNPSELMKSNTLGIKLIGLTTKQFKGTLNISNDDGLKYIIEFKI